MTQSDIEKEIIESIMSDKNIILKNHFHTSKCLAEDITVLDTELFGLFVKAISLAYKKGKQEMLQSVKEKINNHFHNLNALLDLSLSGDFDNEDILNTIEDYKKELLQSLEEKDGN